MGARTQIEARWSELKKQRVDWELENRDIANEMAPYIVRLERDAREKRNDGERLGADIINSTPVDALGTLAAGMMAGITSPAREWFNLTITDKRTSKNPRVRGYLQQVKEVIVDILHSSNWYDVLSNDAYQALGSIGTAGVFVEDNGEGGVRFKPYVFGTYWLDTNSDGVVDTFFHEQNYTVRQIVDKFGLENCGKQVQSDWERGNLLTVYAVVHAVFPRSDKVRGNPGVEGMDYVSLWWERTNPNKDQWLRESGYREFPGLFPRWSTVGDDAYGRGPGWKVVGDCRALQHREQRKAEVVDLIADPATVSRGLDSDVATQPGANTEIPIGQEGDVKVLQTVSPAAITALQGEIMEIQGRINRGMFVHLWQAAIQDERNDRPTATEVEARRQEVMLMLGPLLQSLDNELLEPCINRVFAILDRNDMLPLPPPELEGSEIKVEFISIMHQAQQSTGAAGLRALIGEVLAAAQVDPGVLDKINTDVVADQFATMFGVSADVVRSDEEVAEMRQARAEAQQKQQQNEEALMATEGAKNLSGVEPENLSDVASALGPVAGAQTGSGGL